MTAPEIVRQQLVARLLHVEAEDGEALPTGQRQLTLQSGGRPLSVTVGAVRHLPLVPQQVSGQDLLDLQTSMNLSDNALLRDMVP